MDPVYRKTTLVFASFIVLSLLACNAISTVGYPTPTIDPPTAIPTATSVPLSAQVTLVSVPFIETDQGGDFPPYTLTASTPQLNGSDDPRVKAFNQRSSDLVEKEVDLWRQSFRELPVTPFSNGSFLNVTYALVSQTGDLWSFKFDFSFYADTAAHPGLYSMTLNYELGQGRELALDDLFPPDSNYLEAISKYCIAELSKQLFFEGPFTQGANPTLENYRNWNIIPEGLLITFNEYQVAPYAAGPQQVLVPYEQLSAVIDSQGPLASFIR
jgi:hypothetical protein